MYCISMKPMGYATETSTYVKSVSKNKVEVTTNEAEAKEYSSASSARRAINKISDKLSDNYFYVQLKGVRAHD